jgi:hypothetical protein
MHEKDIELARLLIAREAEMRAKDEALRHELQAVQQRVDEARALSEQRDAYADILAKAADLLQRSDLAVEMPDTAEDESRLAELTTELGALEAQEQQFQDLVHALKDRAPQLFDAATGALKVADDSGSPEATTAGAEPEAAAADQAEPASSVEPAEDVSAAQAMPEVALPEPEEVQAAAPQPAPEAEARNEPVQVAPPETSVPEEERSEPPAEAASDDWDSSVKLYVAGRGQEVPAEDDQYAWTPPATENGSTIHSEPDQPLTEEELERFLQRFNMEKIQKETTEVLGGEAAYVIDAASVLDNIPYYDRDIRGGPVRFIRDELLRDIDLLSRHLKGPVYLVLDQPHDTEQKLSAKVAVRALSPADKGRREAAEELFKKVLAEATTGGTTVCFVTGDLGLGGSMRSRRVHFFPLSDFFRT